MNNTWKHSPALWSSLILVVSQTLTFFVAFRQKVFVETYQIQSPEVSAGLPIAYFFAAVVLMGIVLLLVPLSGLKVLLKVVFALSFAWGAFIVLGLSLPAPVAVVVSGVAGVAWLLKPKVWLHNLLLMVSLASVGSVFGSMMAPWTAMSVMLVISVYDFLAVRFGYMLWMAKRLSESEVIPAFIIPARLALLNLDMKGVSLAKLEEAPAERGFSILGGGDIGFPLLLVVSVFFADGFASSIIVSLFSVVGLIGAYWIQAVFLKGKPVPALPPISVACLVGLLVVRLIG